MKNFLAFVICVLAVMASVGAAHATQVTVVYETFPQGTVLDSNVVTGCDNAVADTFAGYEFLFWDNQGTLSWSPSVTICPGSTNGTASAYYLPTGNGICNPGLCSVGTYGFSIDHNEILPSTQTVIASVAPNSPVVWINPMTSVNTAQAENITANSSIAFPGFSAEPFRYWQQLGTAAASPIGSVFSAGENTSPIIVAFYGPDPCQTLRNELQSCLEEDGEGGKMNCTGLGKALQECEAQNREPQ